MTNLIVTVKFKNSRKTIDKSELLAYIDRKASAILDVGAWLDFEGDPVIPNVLDETYLQALHDIRTDIQNGNISF